MSLALNFEQTKSCYNLNDRDLFRTPSCLSTKSVSVLETILFSNWTHSYSIGKWFFLHEMIFNFKFKYFSWYFTWLIVFLSKIWTLVCHPVQLTCVKNWITVSMPAARKKQQHDLRLYITALDTESYRQFSFFEMQHVKVSYQLLVLSCRARG